LEIHELVCRGAPRIGVAAQFKISPARVTQICKDLDQRFYTEHQENIEALKGRQSQQILHLIHDALNSFVESQEDAVTVKVEDGPEGRTESTTTKGQAGDPRFLEVARKLLSDERLMWGANAPEQHVHRNLHALMPLDERLKVVNENLTKLLPGVVDAPPNIPQSDGPDERSAPVVTSTEVKAESANTAENMASEDGNKDNAHR
tara:strand:- start:3110 stop:3721 length:612 start_codon:yes stop_codon:yes gene_type:complete